MNEDQEQYEDDEERWAEAENNGWAFIDDEDFEDDWADVDDVGDWDKLEERDDF